MIDYKGKRVVVVGGATGMGAATASEAHKLGALVTVLDVADPTIACDKFIRIDLRDKASVEAVINELEGPIDCVFSCAGVGDGTQGLILINFIAQRMLIEGLIAKGAMPRGAAVVVISSTAGNGYGWQQDLERINEFLAISDWEGQERWVEDNATDVSFTDPAGYIFSKRAMSAYVASRALEFLMHGVRINAILPGPTDTPLARANAETWLGYGADYRAQADLPQLTPEEMAWPMLFLGSSAASGIAGTNLIVDRGYTDSGLTGSFIGSGPVKKS